MLSGKEKEQLPPTTQSMANTISKGGIAARHSPSTQGVVQRTLVVGGKFYDTSVLRHLGEPVKNKFDTDKAFQEKFTDEYVVEGGLTWKQLTDQRVGILAGSGDRFSFRNWQEVQAGVAPWGADGSDPIPKSLLRYKLEVEENKFAAYPRLEAAVAALGSRDIPLEGISIDARWNKLKLATTKKEALIEIQSLWGVCGSSAQTLIERIWAAGGKPKMIHGKSHVDKHDAAELAGLLALPVANTTFIQINEPLIHQFTIEKRPDGKAYLHQGFISNYNALWWVGMAEDIAPHLTLTGKKAEDMIAVRDKYGMGRPINIGSLAMGLRNYLEAGLHGEVSAKIWSTLPLNPVASEEMRWADQPIILNAQFYQLEDERAARQKLEAYNATAPLIELVMLETSKLLYYKADPVPVKAATAPPEAEGKRREPDPAPAKKVEALKQEEAPAKKQEAPVIAPAPKASPVAIDQRWDEAVASVPANKLAEWKFTESLQRWKTSDKSAPLQVWSVQYLDWLNQSLVAAGNQLNARWTTITGVLEDIALSRSVHLLKIQSASDYKTWSALHAIVTAGGRLPAAKEYLETPTAFLDGIETAYKGKAQWSAETVRWGKRKGYIWS